MVPIMIPIQFLCLQKDGIYESKSVVNIGIVTSSCDGAEGGNGLGEGGPRVGETWEEITTKDP